MIGFESLIIADCVHTSEYITCLQLLNFIALERCAEWRYDDDSVLNVHLLE